MTQTERAVLITGGSRGLGSDLVQSFLDAGDAVATCSRNPTAATEAWESNPRYKSRFFYEPFDMTDSNSTHKFVRHTVDKFGRIDVLVNNAGVAVEGVMGLLSEVDVDRVIDLNLRATLKITRAVVRQMLRQRGGRIVNVSSIVGRSGYRGLSAYSSTKAALDGLTRSLARELGSTGITVNSVAPGYLETDMSETLLPAQLDQIIRRTPAGRLGTTSDVAAAVKFLVSPAAEFITGHVLVVDGGLTA